MVYKEEDVMAVLSEIYVDVLGSPVAERTLLRIKQTIKELETVEIKNLKDGTIPDHWAELFKAESEGRLIVRPGTVYQTDGVDIYESTVRKVIYDTGHFAFDDDAIGHSVWLSREAAEAALERSKSDGT